MKTRFPAQFAFLLMALFFLGLPLSAQDYSDGNYPGVSSENAFGRVELTVEIRAGKIADIQYQRMLDWDPEKVKEEMKEKIVRQQSSRVDAVSGATLSSQLVSQAVQDALDKAALSSELERSDRVILQTNQGTIELLLYPDRAPKTVENFLALVEKGYYDGIIFHRVIPGFMIQGGDPTGTGRGGSSIWGKPFSDEFHPELRFNRPGLLAMANSGPNTNGSQFFITVAATPWLNDRHTIFGEVIGGYEVVEAIVNAPAVDSLPREEQKILQASPVRGPKNQLTR